MRRVARSPPRGRGQAGSECTCEGAVRRHGASNGGCKQRKQRRLPPEGAACWAWRSVAWLRSVRGQFGGAHKNEERRCGRSQRACGLASPRHPRGKATRGQAWPSHGAGLVSGAPASPGQPPRKVSGRETTPPPSRPVYLTAQRGGADLDRAWPNRISRFPDLPHQSTTLACTRPSPTAQPSESSAATRIF